MDLLVLSYIFHNFMFALSSERYSGIFFEKRRTPLLVLIASYALLFVLLAIPSLGWNIILVRKAIALSTFFIVSLNYKSTMVERFAYCICCFVNLGLFEWSVHTLVSPGYQPLWDITPNMTLGYNPYFFIISGLAIYFVALVLRRMFKNIKKSLVNPIMFWILAIFIPSLSIITFLVVVLYLPTIIAIIAIVALFGINVLLLYTHNALSAAYEKNLKSALESQEKDYYFSQCQLMQKSVEHVKSIRHDMKLHLSTAKDLAADGFSQVVSEYLGDLLGNINKSEIYSDTGNISFDSIINFKLNNANIENLNPLMRFLIPSSVNIDVADIVTILGNLLDNALEALASPNVLDKTLKLDIELSKGSLFIQIDNIFDGNLKFAKDKDGDLKHIITRKENGGGEHGHGLKNIRRSVEKYDGQVDISCEGNIFSVTVVLYVQDMAKK